MEKVCECCVTTALPNFRHKVNFRMTQAFNELFPTFKLNEGFICIPCYDLLESFQKFKKAVTKNREKLEKRQNLKEKNSKNFSPKVQVRTTDIGKQSVHQRSVHQVTQYPQTTDAPKMTIIRIPKSVSVRLIEKQKPLAVPKILDPLKVESNPEKSIKVVQAPLCTIPLIMPTPAITLEDDPLLAKSKIKVEESSEEVIEVMDDDESPEEVSRFDKNIELVPRNTTSTLLAAQNIWSSKRQQSNLLKSLRGKWGPRLRSSLNNDTTLSKSADKSFICDLCGFNCENKEAFSRHFVIHEAKSKFVRFPCDRCTTTFATSEKLITHQNNRHPERNEFTCPNCCSIFSTVTRMRQHQRINRCYKQLVKKSVKKNLTEMVCVHCGKLVKMARMRIHIRRVHEKERSHLCTTCGKAFASLSALNNHNLTQHSEGVKQFECDHCDRRISTKKNLKAHIELQHFNMKKIKFRCEICEKGFAEMFGIKRHMNDAHPASEIDDGLKVSLLTNFFHCPTCDHKFYRKLSCQQHMRKYHK